MEKRVPVFFIQESASKISERLQCVYSFLSNLAIQFVIIYQVDARSMNNNGTRIQACEGVNELE